MTMLRVILPALIISIAIVAGAVIVRPEDSVTRIGRECAAYAEEASSLGVNVFDLLHTCRMAKLLGR